MSKGKEMKEEDLSRKILAVGGFLQSMADQIISTPDMKSKYQQRASAVILASQRLEQQEELVRILKDARSCILSNSSPGNRDTTVTRPAFRDGSTDQG